MIDAPIRRGRWADHPYVAVGDGPRTLLVIPGLNDPLCRVTDAWWFSLLAATYCRRYADQHAVAMVSRPEGLPEDVSIRELSEGYARVLREVGPADVLGLSMGGFVVQHLAAERPEHVERAVLGLAAARLSPGGREMVERWRAFAARDDWQPICEEAAGVVASGPRGWVARGAASLYGRLGAVSAVDRADFLASVDATLAHDATSWLGDLAVPTLVLGGTDDPFFDREDYRQTAASIPDARYVEFDAGHEAVLDRRRQFDGAIHGFLYD